MTASLAVKSGTWINSLKWRRIGQPAIIVEEFTARLAHGSRIYIAEASVSLEKLKMGSFRLSTETHYQVSNRLAYLNKLAQEGVPTVLMYLGWLQSPDWPAEPLRDNLHWKKLVIDHMKAVGPVAFLEKIFPTVTGGSMQMIVRSLRA